LVGVVAKKIAMGNYPPRIVFVNERLMKVGLGHSGNASTRNYLVPGAGIEHVWALAVFFVFSISFALEQRFDLFSQGRCSWDTYTRFRDFSQMDKPTKWLTTPWTFWWTMSRAGST
jgi:hypothetical protein